MLIIVKTTYNSKLFKIYLVGDDQSASIAIFLNNFRAEASHSATKFAENPKKNGPAIFAKSSVRLWV